MFVYSMIMFVVAAVLGAVSIAIYKGKTDLIHDYHQTKVTDKAAYGKAFGKALFVVALAPLLSGMIGFLGGSNVVVIFAAAVLITGIATGVGLLVAVQRKYNKGVF